MPKRTGNKRGRNQNNGGKEQKKRSDQEKGASEPTHKCLQVEDDTFWKSTPQKDVHEFYAAARFNELTNRPWTFGATPHNCNRIRDERPKTDLLDYVALLFARARALPNSTDNSKSTAVANVTATAMLKPVDNIATIVIAKNEGPQTFDGQSDLEFARKLQSWYNQQPGEIPVPTAEDDIMRDLLGFWIRRHQYHLYHIRRIRDDNPFSWSSDTPPTNLRDLVRDASIKVPGSVPCFTRNWSRLSKLLRKFRDCGTDDDSISDYVNWLCLEDTDSWGEVFKWPLYYQPYLNSITSQDGFERNIDFLRVGLPQMILHFRLLKTPIAVWNAFKEFRRWSINGQDQSTPILKLSFRFMPEAQLKPSISVQNIFQIFRGWAKDSSYLPVHDEVSKLKKLLHPKGFSRRVHCELQLLRLHGKVELLTEHGELESRKLSDPGIWALDIKYIGSSKNACYLCWSILRSLDFCTKGTHGKLYSGCGFPLAELPEGGTEKIRACLVRIREMLLERMQRSVQTATGSIVKTPLALRQNQVCETVPVAGSHLEGVITRTANLSLADVYHQSEELAHPKGVESEQSIDDILTVERFDNDLDEEADEDTVATWGRLLGSK
jgi:OTT_1508-like deaminase